MIRQLWTAGAFGALCACGGGEFLFPEPGDTDTPPATAASTYSLQVNKLDYDAEADQVVVNNLPFDGPDGVYERVAARTEVDGFGVYTSLRTAETGQRQYFAVFRRTENADVAAIGTPDYQGFGFGGTATTRRNGSTLVPNEGEYVYTGLYGGVRTFDEGGGLELVRGDVLLEVDIRDFDDTGAVEGRVTNRTGYSIDGVPLRPMPTIIFATTSIDAASGTIAEGTASTTVDGTARDSGTYEGLFVGPNGGEIAGRVTITGEFNAYRIIETVDVADGMGNVTQLEQRIPYAQYLALQQANDTERLQRITITETGEGFEAREVGVFTATDD